MMELDSLVKLIQTLEGTYQPSNCCGSTKTRAVAHFDFNYGGSVEIMSTNIERRFTFDLSAAKADEKGLHEALHDLAAIRVIAESHPDSLLEMVRSVQNGDIDGALKRAAEIGLTEAELRKRGGGWIFLVVFAVAVAIVLAAPTPISVEATPPPPNPALSLPKSVADDADKYLNK
jgi:hypothetical protein